MQNNNRSLSKGKNNPSNIIPKYNTNFLYNEVEEIIPEGKNNTKDKAKSKSKDNSKEKEFTLNTITYDINTTNTINTIKTNNTNSSKKTEFKAFTSNTPIIPSNKRNKSQSRPHSQCNSLNNISSISGDKVLCPKTNCNFDNKFVNRTERTDKINKSQSKSINKSSINKPNIPITCLTPKSHNSPNRRNDYSLCTLDSQNINSVDLYLQRRHTEAQDKLQKLKMQQMQKEEAELRDRPKISQNSKRIVEKLVNTNQSVVERLTSKGHDRKKAEKLNKIEEINNKNKNKPTINPTSEKLQRTIDDLYYWQQDLNVKMEEIKQAQNHVGSYKPQILKESEEILQEKHPYYLKTKVEDRLIEKGQM